MPNERHSLLTLENVSSVNSLRVWAKERLGNIYTNKKVPNKHLLIYLDYIEGVVKKEENIDKVFWLKQIRELRDNIGSLDKAE
jgi:hypothetical protein